MFLAQVYRHSKILFLLMLAFIAAQLFVVYNHGMVFSPFYNYWMYASRFTRSDSLPVVVLYSGGKPVRGADYNQQDWDKIILSYQYVRHPEANQKLYKEISRLTGKAGHELGPQPFLMPSGAGNPDSLLRQWRQYAGNVSHRTIDSVTEGIYYWNGQNLVRR